MKIGLIRRGYSATGGAEAYLLRLADGLARTGHEPVLVTSEAWPEDRWTHGEIVRRRGRTPAQFAEDFSERPPDVDLTFSLERVPGCDVFRAGDGVHAAWLYRRGLFEPVWRRWLRLLNPKHLSLLRLECEVFQSARGIIANSQMVADEIRRWQEYPAERIRVVPNGIGPAVPSIPQEEARARLDLPADAFCVLFVGSGWERKGLRFAIKAVEAIGAPAVLLVAGRGKAVRHAPVNVRFLGPLSDLSTLFSAADVFTLPTLYDPFSNACLEALAAGLPVVTTPANGFSEIITPGIHGDVVPAGDVPALAAALSAWKGRSRTDTAAACRTLASAYTIEKNVEATLAVLREAAGDPNEVDAVTP